MSGIIGILQLDGAPVDAHLLEKMTSHMAFRGPDDQQTWHKGSIGLGCAQLRTTQESAQEQQPFCLDDRLWIVADARVDDRTRLIDDLASRGRPISPSTPDVELIAHAYDQWQEHCTDHLIGDFAFVIWDQQRRRLFCAHDQFSVVPFFYAQTKTSLIFGNTLSALRLHPGLSNTLNEQVIADMIIFSGNRNLTTTIWADIQRLGPAHQFIVENKQIQINRYWAVPDEVELVSYRRAEDYIAHFADIFERCVADRLRSNRLAAQLTGGLDTTSIVATAHKLLGKCSKSADWQTYTVAFSSLLDEQEGEYAALTAQALDIPHQVLFFEDHSLGTPEQNPDWMPPEPAPAMLHDAAYTLLQQANAHGRILFSGMGGDAMLAQEPFYLQTLIAQGQFRRLFADLKNQVRVRGWKRPSLGLSARLHQWQGRERRLFPFPEWLDPDLIARLDLLVRKESGEEEERTRHHRRDLPIYPYWINMFAWQNPGYTGLPLRTYYPFFDLRLFDYLLTIPSVPWFESKALLRAAMRGLLPEALLQRPKTPLTRDTNTEHTLALNRGPQPWELDLANESRLAPYIDHAQFYALVETPAKTDHGGYRQVKTALYLAYWLRHIK